MDEIFYCCLKIANKQFNLLLLISPNPTVLVYVLRVLPRNFLFLFWIYRAKQEREWTGLRKSERRERHKLNFCSLFLAFEPSDIYICTVVEC